MDRESHGEIASLLKKSDSEMRIGENGDSTKRKLKPPPDYGARGMQIRLFACVALLMFVVTAAMEARNPKRWLWLTKLGTKSETKDAIDPRLPSARQPILNEPIVGSGKPRGTSVAADEVELSPLDRAWKSGWEEIFPEITYDDREFVYAALKAARHESPISKLIKSETAQSLEHLDAAWAGYVRRAQESLTSLTSEERASWDDVLQHLDTRWKKEHQPAITKVTTGEKLSLEEKTRLEYLQELLDAIQLHQIRDNTVWRASEREIWFRLIEKLQALTPAELQSQSAGLLSYASLFKQPEAYRGKLVTVRGRAEAAYHVAAPKNDCGVTGYWIFWLLPEGGPTSPIAVYSLEKPDGFPTIEFSDLGKKKMPSLEDVEFTGYFVKRYAYQGQGGIYTAPLLLAKMPTWLRSSDDFRKLPSMGFFAALVGALALFATGLAVFVYYQYRPGSGRKLVDEIELPKA